MSLSIENPLTQFVATGSELAFAIGFTFERNDDVLVSVLTSGQTVDLTPGTEFLISGDGLAGSGVVNIALAKQPAAGAVVSIRRRTPIDQADSFGDLGLFLPSMAGRAFDKLTRIAQEHGAVLDRSVLVPVGEDTLVMPAEADRSGKFLKFDNDGRLVAAEGGGTSATMADYLANGSGAVFRTVQNRLRDMYTVKDFGALGDGVTDDTGAWNLLSGVDGIRIVPSGAYAAPGGVVPPLAGPQLTLAGNVTLEGVAMPFLAISELSPKQPPAVHMFLRQDNALRNDVYMAFFQRNVTVPTGYDASFATTGFIMETNIVATDNTSTEFAISGVLNSWNNAANLGDTATSGVANKRGLSPVFGGHFQANDYNVYVAPTDVTPVIGAEMNIQAIGLDHPTANLATGQRQVLTLLAKSLAPGAGAEIGSALMISTDLGPNNPWFRNGLVIQEREGNTNPFGTAINIRTSGAHAIHSFTGHTVADILLEGNSSVGIQLTGNYAAGAMRIPSDNILSLGGGETAQLSYVSGNSRFTVSDATTPRFQVSLGAAPKIYLNGVGVVGPRDTGWVGMTGASDKSSLFDVNTVTLPQLAARVSHLQNVLTAVHGLIGT